VAPSQTILVTVVPRGVAVDTDTLPVSLFVTPRLRGADRLGAFPDWQTWTERVHDHGLRLTISCAGRSLAFAADPAPLSPELWAGLFNAGTFVRSHEFDDYSDRAVLSYPVRETLSTLKRIYQEAGFRLALPEPLLGRDDERGNRRILRQLLAGLEVHWNPESGEGWRVGMRRAQAANAWRDASHPSHQTANGWRDASHPSHLLDGEGMIIKPVSVGGNRAVALPFAVFHHMPTPRRDELAPDWDTILDFHQALASVNAYPALQRALAVVLEFELPAEFVPVTETADTATISATLDAGWDWAIAPEIPPLETACLHVRLDDGRVVFLAAPRSLTDRAAPTQVVGLLDLDPQRFGVAQVDVDGAMHKAIILAETWHEPDADRNLDPDAQPEQALHPQVFDPEATLPALRSGGFSLFADGRAQHLLDAIRESKAFNSAVETSANQPRPFCAEDLVRGYRLDVWDSATEKWHSVHARTADYSAGGGHLHTDLEEGFVQLGATQAAEGAQPAHDDLYLHEAIARWAGWSLAVEMPGKHLSRYADPDLAVPPDGDDPNFRTNEAKTPFELRNEFGIVTGSLPQLRFGRRYRFRARVADLAGAGLDLDEPITDELSAAFSLPREEAGFPYLRYEPVAAPAVVIRDEAAVTGAGSALDRLVIRTYNDGPANDDVAAKTGGAERHILPPRTSVELGERLGMFDDADGELRSNPATWKLISDRDAAELSQAVIDVAGKSASYPLEPGALVDPLPYLPDGLSAGAAIRDLPGTPSGAVGRASAAGPPGSIEYEALDDPNPRPGSATLVSFEAADWTKTKGFRLAVAEPADDGGVPGWDPAARVFTVRLPKATLTTVPLSSYLEVDALNLMGQWRWLREYLDRLAEDAPARQHFWPGADVDRIAHVLQRAIEGGHWLLTPPKLLTLVHAVQQPLGRPEFIPLHVEHDPAKAPPGPLLQTKPITGRTDPTELAAITAWRRFGATDAYLIGALRIHGASTAKLDLEASWDDYVDDTGDEWTLDHHETHVDELPVRTLDEHYLEASSLPRRLVGYYEPENDQIAFTRAGDWTGRPDRNEVDFEDAAPRHLLDDAKHRRVTYTAIATSRFREYFSPELDFTRTSDPVTVDIPASARPVAPSVVYVLPTFGWQRQTDSNVMRSVRFGGGLRVYLDRPWFSSGEGELLGVALWSSENGTLDQAHRDKFKPYITQWGMDPIWQTDELSGVPGVWNFPDAVDVDYAVTLEEANASRHGTPGRIDVVGFAPEYDKDRQLWFADLTLDTSTATYAPFVRLALVRYQPRALLDAKVSRVVLADFAQLTPDRSAIVTSDPYRPRSVNVVVSGVTPRAPGPAPGERPNTIRVRVQERDPAIASDLGWRDVSPAKATVTTRRDGAVGAQQDLGLWAGTVSFAVDSEPAEFRLLIEEHESIASDSEPRGARLDRLVYAESFELDHALVGNL
jgi:hypothetical protein